MSRHPKRHQAEAMLQMGYQPTATAAGNMLPTGETQMILTLDQLAPNPENPRTTRNPRYDDIKASIRARGLDSVPKVTRDPESSSDTYIFSDGGNTRYAILSELWQETGEERFWRINVIFRPWPGRRQCVIGHLAENEARGDLTFIEKALGVRRARDLYEEEYGKLSVRKFAQLLTADGMPLNASSISRMMNAVDYLWKSMPGLLLAGIGRPQINMLLALRQGALELWQEYEKVVTPAQLFDDVWSACCRKFDAPELWQPEAFRDELIGDCLASIPHQDLNYDRWLLALEPRKKSQDVEHLRDTEPPGPVVEEQTDFYSGNSIYSGDSVSEDDRRDSVATGNTFTSEAGDEKSREKHPAGDIPPGAVSSSSPEDTSLPARPLMLSITSETGERGVTDTDIEHQQRQAFRLAWAIADSHGYGGHIIPDHEHVKAPGYRATDATPAPVTLLLTSLTVGPLQCTAVNLNCIQGALFASLFTGGTEHNEPPGLDEENAQRLVQLLTVMRRLRALQRKVVADDGSLSDEE
ncbi:ParB family protein [Klebsiella aerogenes]|uniref:Chromosome partitioning protein ParB n=1 Tax=Klebsiella aerogenes TaxID=548 RepID=A0AAP9R1G9_KLEAE|nr:ParB family protein [Klebsiella aerogenes]QMR42896.1 chromosome partitioning protein ParB [Klebsiella aerogenes]